MHRVFEAQLLIITIIASLFLLLSCGREDEYIRLPDDLDTRSVKQTYAFAEDFVTEYLGSTYKLRRMNANFSDHGETWTVIYEYTKREGRKKDTYRLLFASDSGRMQMLCDSWADKHIADVTVNPGNWGFDTEDIFGDERCPDEWDNIYIESDLPEWTNVSVWNERMMVTQWEIEVSTEEETV